MKDIVEGFDDEFRVTVIILEEELIVLSKTLIKKVRKPNPGVEMEQVIFQVLVFNIESSIAEIL